MTKPRSVRRAVRRTFVDSPTSFGARARQRRWQLVDDLFPDLEAMTVVDLGGTLAAWQQAPTRPAMLVVVNLDVPEPPSGTRIQSLQGDACTATAVLRAAGAPSRYDLCFSNSLIEHVGGHARRVELASEVDRLAPRHWVQTPYRYFPVEPHWLFPLMQFLPIRLKAEVALGWPLSHSAPANRTDATVEVQWTELLSITEMRGYFPTSEIRYERALGLVKSLIAVRGGTSVD